MSGEVDVVKAGVTLTNDTIVTVGLWNKLITDMILKIRDGAVAATQLADGSIDSDKLSSTLSAQLGVADGSITLAKLASGFLLPTSNIADNAVDKDKVKDSDLDYTHMSTTNTVAFSAELSPATTSYAKLATILCDVEDRDSHGAYDPVTGKFTPGVHGLYCLGGHVQFDSIPDTGGAWSVIQKNGITAGDMIARGSHDSVGFVSAGTTGSTVLTLKELNITDWAVLSWNGNSVVSDPQNIRGYTGDVKGNTVFFGWLVQPLS